MSGELRFTGQILVSGEPNRNGDSFSPECMEQIKSISLEIKIPQEKMYMLGQAPLGLKGSILIDEYVFPPNGVEAELVLGTDHLKRPIFEVVFPVKRDGRLPPTVYAGEADEHR
jgi:hypothetical protein